MNDPAAVTGILAGYRTTVDGGLTLMIRLDESQAARYHDAFHGINIDVVVARLNDEQVT